MSPTGAFTLLGLALMTVSLAGCSGGGSDNGGTPTVSRSASSTAPPPPPAPTSDTLHFLTVPEMSTVLSGAEVATPVGAGNFFGGGGGGGGNDQPGAEWAYKVKARTNVTAGEVRLWIVIKETLYETPSSPLGQQCTWALTVAIGSNSENRACLNEPTGPIQPVTKELVFPLILASPVNIEANETITVTLERSAYSPSANNAVDVLSGSTERDSRIVLRGLKEPIRTR